VWQGKASLSYSNGMWSAAVIPVGLAGYLFVTVLIFAKTICRIYFMTLADFSPASLQTAYRNLGQVENALQQYHSY
jgi:hypothetical protein